MRPFLLERYFARHEFTARHLLSPSDCQPLTLRELLAMAGSKRRAMWDALTLAYTESAGHPELRDAIAARYDRCAPEELLVCVPEEGIFLAMQALLEPGDAMVHLFPAYQSLYEVAAGTGTTARRCSLTADGGTWRLDLEALRGAITPETRVLTVNFPHNPTGFLPTRAEFETLLAIARDHDLWIFSDEMYRDLEHDPGDRLPSVGDVYEKSVTLGGLSKTFALPGLRIGWLRVGDAPLRERILALKDYTTICSAAPAEILALIALDNADAIISRNRELVAANLELARAFFSGYPERLEWLEPRGGSIAFPRLVAGSALAFCDAAVAAHSLMIVPDAVFDMDDGHFRIGLGRSDFPEALAVFKSVLEGGVG